jgi:hypothetical protein
MWQAPRPQTVQMPYVSMTFLEGTNFRIAQGRRVLGEMSQ